VTPAGRDAGRTPAGGAPPPGRDRGPDAAIQPVPPEIEVVVDDLAFYEGEAIARPVTSELAATTPLLRRLELAAGPALDRQIRQQGEPLAVGAAVVSGAGDLRVQLLVHAVVMSREERVSVDGVRRATLAALQRAVDFEIGHLALPPFGLGAGNLDVDESVAAMLDAVRQHVRRQAERARWPRRLTFVVENEDERQAVLALLPREEA
jgi:O-acetyl-ADP-ribose deacetylase (regulator of RNase III)